jgi:hypothetical protein
MKSFFFRKALLIGGLLIVTLTAGCSAGQGLSSNRYLYNSGDAGAYPNNTTYGSSYSGYGSAYPNL